MLKVNMDSVGEVAIVECEGAISDGDELTCPHLSCTRSYDVLSFEPLSHSQSTRSKKCAHENYFGPAEVNDEHGDVNQSRHKWSRRTGRIEAAAP
jgi:hypothetical protein